MYWYFWLMSYNCFMQILIIRALFSCRLFFFRRILSIACMIHSYKAVCQHTFTSWALEITNTLTRKRVALNRANSVVLARFWITWRRLGLYIKTLDVRNLMIKGPLYPMARRGICPGPPPRIAIISANYSNLNSHITYYVYVSLISMFHANIHYMIALSITLFSFISICYLDIKHLPSQVGPWKLPTHSHENVSPSFVQIPSFLHGSESHGVGFSSR